MADFNLGLDDELPEEGSVAAQERANDPIMRYLDETVDGDKNKTTQDTGAEAGKEAAKPEAGKEQGAAKPDSDSGNKDNNGKQKPDKKGEENKGGAGGANNGDLTLQDGTVVKAGAERRLYESNRLLESQISMTRNELNQANDARQRMQQELNNMRQTVQSLNGVEPDVLNVGVKIARDLARDPVGTLRNLLTEAVAAGHTIDGIGSGIDMAGIREAVAQQFKPYIEFYNQHAQSGNAQEEAVKEVSNFYQQFPDAQVHDDVLAAVLERNPQMPISEAYFQLRKAAIERGLDWSKPLGPQMASEQQQQTSTDNAANKAPMPNGRTPAGDNVVDANRSTVAHEATSTGDIVKQAMRENGLNI